MESPLTGTCPYCCVAVVDEKSPARLPATVWALVNTGDPPVESNPVLLVVMATPLEPPSKSSENVCATMCPFYCGPASYFTEIAFIAAVACGDVRTPYETS